GGNFLPTGGNPASQSDWAGFTSPWGDISPKGVGTAYKITASSDSFVDNFTANITPSNQSTPSAPDSVLLNSIVPNTQYQYKIDAINGDGTFTASVPGTSFWTHPSTPTASPTNATENSTSITAQFPFAGNPSITNYQLQASADPTFAVRSQ